MPSPTRIQDSPVASVRSKVSVRSKAPIQKSPVSKAPVLPEASDKSVKAVKAVKAVITKEIEEERNEVVRPSNRGPDAAPKDPPLVLIEEPSERATALPTIAAEEGASPGRARPLLQQINASLRRAKPGESPRRESPGRESSDQIQEKNLMLGAPEEGQHSNAGELVESRSARSVGKRSGSKRSGGMRSGNSGASRSSRTATSPIGEQDFEPLTRLGGGSFGDVYLVRRKTAPGQGLGPLYAMKALRKRSNQEESWLRYVRSERDVLAQSDHPFIVKLRYAFQTATKLFLVMDFCPGGDLETLLAPGRGPVPEERAKLYIAEILLAIRDLHDRHIIYRDLKPDNVVLDNEGHAQLVDFGMAKGGVSQAHQGAETFCGSVKYLAPEMLQKEGHGRALDWYLMGVLLYEMVTGVTPFFSSNRDTLFNNILYGTLKLPRTMSPDLKDLLAALLRRAPARRLGSADSGAEEIMKHPFFNDIDWHALLKKENTGSFWPAPPRHTIEDYQEAFPESELTPE